MGKIASCYDTGERYISLRIVGVIFTLTGMILLTIGGLMLMASLYTLLAGKLGAPPVEVGPFRTAALESTPLGGGWGAALFLIWSIAILVSGLQSVAFGALIRLLIHLEENTRTSALALEKIRMNLEPKPKEVEPFLLS